MQFIVTQVSFQGSIKVKLKFALHTSTIDDDDDTLISIIFDHLYCKYSSCGMNIYGGFHKNAWWELTCILYISLELSPFKGVYGKRRTY